MERVFTIRTKSNEDPNGVYPSERRYSSSNIFGISVVFLVFGMISTFLSTLIFYKNTLNQNFNETDYNNSRLEQRVAKDLELVGEHDYYSFSVNIPSVVAAFGLVMAISCFFSFATGLLAKIRWYVDQNITIFFSACCFSLVSSLLSLGVAVLCLYFHDFNSYSPLNHSILSNIIIVFSLTNVWSILASCVAYQGMKNDYPDDMVTDRRGTKISKKGSLKHLNLPPDIVKEFPKAGKLAKYMPEPEDNNLPKSESNLEYQQRVNKFLTSSENDS